MQSGFAIFENLNTVEVKRCGEDSLVGRKIPRMLILTAYTMNGWKSGGGGGRGFCWVFKSHPGD